MEDLRDIFPDASQLQIRQLSQYGSLLQLWNQRINLVSRKDVANLWIHHFLPSLIVLKSVSISEAAWVLDVGSGGGFPAIPLKIMRPQWQLLMVESTRKKTLFLSEAIAELGFTKTSVIHSRVEDLTNRSELLHKFDLITARAVAAIPRLIDWGKPFLNEKGRLLLWKGESDIAELEAPGIASQYVEARVHRVPAPFLALSAKFAAQRFFEIKP